MIRHYTQDHKQVICESQDWLKLATQYPCHTTCPDCLRSEKYQQDLITFEIGCDGDLDQWSSTIVCERRK